MSVAVEEKSSSTSTWSFLTDNAIAATIADSYSNLSAKRKLLGLENPGTVDNIAREVQKDVLLSNFMFSGLRCDLQKVFSINPLFRLQHGFAMGSQALPPWQLMALYGTSDIFMQAAYSSDRSLTAWGNLRWTPRFVTKTQTSIDPRQTQTMVQIENEYTGDDFSASIKALSPSVMEGGLTGIFIGSYLQSITPKLALGLEGVWQRPALNSKPETALSYCARYKSTDWIASAQWLSQGSLGVTYWRRLTDKVEAGVDCQLQFAPGMGASMFGGVRREGTTTVGLKYSFTNSVYRAQVDSTGKFGVVLERRVAPPVTLTFAAEIDQWKNTHKLGVAVSLEGAPEELQEIMERPENQSAIPPPI
ncbi:mitochondrial import receptor subunit TOM40 [Cladophialophora psammophila CBS 110553]|uniref:Mitochondrial import receptor subunit TOM40 n=1 Tax=Cladophialophora psammophila CBS 110553 TaxID=1182543 RepID=W9WVQ9_9EURO|nr:mitochondrial import receptor subunit TOM40 [Cladophialophora psammophila CBS 110553]EXJ72028.1 mitochondrial import receptor subunit TOM40 [Cladophialophora psammophila CBS 110553]